MKESIKEFSKIKKLPLHPPPLYEKTIGEWIESLAEENFTLFKVIFLYITKIAKDIGFIRSLEKLTGIYKFSLSKLENEFKDKFYNLKRICIIKGCNYKRRSRSDLFEHFRNVHHLGDGWYFCDICDFKAKLIQDFEKHLNQGHTLDEIRDFYHNN